MDQHVAVTQSYGCGPTPTVFHTAAQLLSDPQPHIRQQAVTVLTALGHQGHCLDRSTVSNVDAIFQRLCVVAATDIVTRLRLQALQALANFHHASTPIKVQALSKKATLRVALPSTAATQQQHHVGKKRKQLQPQHAQQQWEQPDAGLLDAATGALLHATEDDFPRVRLAAVAAVVALSSQDQLFADAAGLLLADLVPDQLPEVRMEALKALLDQAAAFQLHKQAQQQQQVHAGRSQQQQQQGPELADHLRQEQQVQGGGRPTGHDDVDMGDAEGSTQQQDRQDSDTGSQGQEAASESDTAQQQPQDSAAAASALQQQQQQRRSKARKSDLPPWGKNALLAAANTLSDAEPAARQLALQLLQHLPPGNVPDLVIVVRGLAACCQRYPDQHAQQAWGLVNSLSRMRAEMITLAPGKLVTLLRNFLQLSSAAEAADDVSAAPGAAHGDTLPREQQGSAQAAAAAAADVLGSSAAADITMLPQGAQVLAALLLLGVQQRKHALPSLLEQLEKAGLLELPALQRWRARLCAVHNPQQS